MVKDAKENNVATIIDPMIFFHEFMETLKSNV
jgi:hypothetical protein